MRDRDLYARILSLSAPWHVSDVHLDVKAGSVEIVIEHRGQCRGPTCGKACPGYDVRRRQWRHLDTCQFRTILTADMPRTVCLEDGVPRARRAAGADPVGGARIAVHRASQVKAVFIDWMKDTSFVTTARRLGLSFDEASQRDKVDAIMAGTVERELEQRDGAAPVRVGLDDTSFQKRHEQEMVATDLEGTRVISVRFAAMW